MTKILNAVMTDKSLSVEAKAIFAYIFSFCNLCSDVVLDTRLIMSDLRISKDRFYKHRKSLINKNFVMVKQLQVDGIFGNTLYEIKVGD